ncbi:MAG TPA: glycosyltransferase family 2 protein [Candidatus Binatia bacterium]
MRSVPHATQARDDAQHRSPTTEATPCPAPARGVSVVVPVYDSATILPRLVERLAPVLRAVARDYELILVNDGSRDASWSVIEELARTHDWVRGIDLMRNYGQHNALLCGIRAARHEVVVTMDDDLQHPPEEIPRLLAELDRGHDVVYGAPLHEQHGFLRDVASRVTKLALAQTMGAPIARKVSAFRALRTRLRDAFAAYDGFFVSIDVLLTWGTTRFSAVPVEHAPRQDGTSNYTFRKLVTHAMNMMTGFSVFPLQIASLVGFGFTLFGLAVLAYVIGRYLIQGSSVPGFPFLASVIAIFSGAQLFALGIIGEYLARVHFRTMNRPPYTVRSLSEPASAETTASAASTTDGSAASPRR